MPREDSGAGGEETAFQSARVEDQWRRDTSSGRQSGGPRSDEMTGEKSGTLGGEANREYEVMTTGRSHDHSRSANRSPRSTTGSTSTSTKSEQVGSGRGHAHREMMTTVAEMKKRLPSEKRSRSKASTVEALHYALNCVKQVQANGEYYKLLMRNGQEERPDAPLCTVEELERVTSEHTPKNTDSFLVVFSLASGRVLYASEQAPSILCCKRRFLESAKFVELLFHQDVDVFYSHTAQPHLPPWSHSKTTAVLFECAQVKSFFCRIRGGKDREGEMRYNPFRFTPYLLKVRGASRVEEEPCCLAMAERITSGYEAPRIPMDKRIFTSTHSPGCVFLEVDDRAVPLLGYLPQDLIGTSLLTCVHPEDRPLMLSMHRKVLKYAGQSPFEHSPVRLRCQNGDYVTLDTSWSSFINPWSRKVAFIIGRHKVRTIPLNEDVFAACSKGHLPVTHEEIRDLQATIYKLFLQPIHKNGSSGYGSLGSNGSHEHYISVASSSDSNGNAWEDAHREPMTLQQICADVNKVQRWGQQVHPDPPSRTTPSGHPTAPSTNGIRDHEGTRKGTHIPSYQQINCVDNIIRFLESCTGPALKRPLATSSSSSSSSSSASEEDKMAGATDTPQASSDVAVALDSQVSLGSTAEAVVGAPLTDITMSTKAMSVVSLTSQCSYSSTIVHVPQPESEVTALEDAPMGSEPADAPPTPARPPPSPTPTEPQLVGLTKEVLSAHTQNEEQQYVDRFRHRILQSPFSSYLQQDDGSMALSQRLGENAGRPVSAARREALNRSRTGKPRHKRAKPQGSSHGPPRWAPDSSWPSSESSQPQMGAPYTPTAQLQAPYFHIVGQEHQPPAMTPTVPPEQHRPGYHLNVLPNNVPNFALVQPPAHPFVTPVVAVILPGYPAFGAGYPSPVYSPLLLPQAQFSVGGFAPAAAAAAPIPPPQYQAHHAPPPPPPATGTPLCPSRASSSLGEEEEEEVEEEVVPGPPALFSSSRSSSPLQLDLLQEELPKPGEGANMAASPQQQQQQHTPGGDAPGDSGHHDDGSSSSSELLDLLLLQHQEDARSGTGSNASGSNASGSGGSEGSGASDATSTSLTGSSASSKYSVSYDAPGRQPPPYETHPEDSLWSMIQSMPRSVMMTYQIHTRDQKEVLAEDREKLRVMQPLQPWFSQEQREELATVHPWVQQRTLPPEIDTQGCVTCSQGPGTAHPPRPPLPDGAAPLECPNKDSRPAVEP